MQRKRKSRVTLVLLFWMRCVLRRFAVGKVHASSTVYRRLSLGAKEESGCPVP